jgi:hypothetical protein
MIQYKGSWTFEADEVTQIKSILIDAVETDPHWTMWWDEIVQRSPEDTRNQEECRVDNFIDEIELYCSFVRTQSIAESKALRSSLKKSIERTVYFLEQVYIPRYQGFVHDEYQYEELKERFYSKRIETIGNLLVTSNLIEDMKDIEKLSRIPKAISSCFVLDVCGAYEIHVGTPTTYKDGTFYQLICYLYECCGLAKRGAYAKGSIYPEKAIKAALKGRSLTKQIKN